MHQQALFFDDINEALRALIAAMGGAKTVGHALRPELGPEEAGRWLADCLNPTRREKLAPEQVLWLLRQGREHGQHAAMEFIAGEAGYARPVPVEPDDERAALQRQAIEAVRHMGDLVRRMERLSGGAA